MWHFPLHLLPTAPRFAASLPARLALLVLGTVLLSILLTWIFNTTGGRLLLVVLTEAALNTNRTVLSTTPRFPAAHVGIYVLGLFVPGVIWRYGNEHLSRSTRLATATWSGPRARQSILL